MPESIGDNPSSSIQPHNTAAPSRPRADDCCPHCNYSLRDLPSYRCPECGHRSSEKELAASRRYIRTPIRFAVNCILYPLGGFLVTTVIVFLLLTVVGEMGSQIVTFMFISFFVAIPYSLVHLGILIGAAARLTQVQIMKRKSPHAIFANPRKALPLFLLHFVWMSFLPFVILAFLLNWCATVVAGN